MEEKVFYRIYRIDGDVAYVFNGPHIFKKKMTSAEAERFFVGEDLYLKPSELIEIY